MGGRAMRAPYGSERSDDIVRRRKDRGDGDLLIRHGFAMPPSPLGKAWWKLMPLWDAVGLVVVVCFAVGEPPPRR